MATLLQTHFVALASDCDAPERPLIELVTSHMADATMLPFVLFVDADGQWLDGMAGSIEPAGFQQKLEALIG